MTELCVDTDVYGLRPGEKACNSKDLAFNEGQGGPVAVTNIETKMLLDSDEDKVKPQLIIHIENKGNGEVISKGTFEHDIFSFGLYNLSNLPSLNNLNNLYYSIVISSNC